MAIVALHLVHLPLGSCAYNAQLSTNVTAIQLAYWQRREFPKLFKLIMVEYISALFVSPVYIQCCYNRVFFYLQNTCNWHLKAYPWHIWNVFCEFKIWLMFCSIQYCVVHDCIISADDCIWDTSLIITMHADGLPPKGAKPSAGSVLVENSTCFFFSPILWGWRWFFITLVVDCIMSFKAAIKI